MSASLFVLANEYRAIADKLEEMDLDEQTIADTLEGLSGDIEAKSTNVAMFIKNLEVSAEAIKAAEGEMAKRRKAIEARVERLRKYLMDNMIFAGISKIECPYFRIAIKDNPESVVIDAESQIPDEFMRQPETPPPTPDKALIKEVLKANVNVSWAHLARGKRVEIK